MAGNPYEVEHVSIASIVAKLKANPENVAPSAMANCINASVAMAVSRIQTDLDEVAHDKVGNVRTAMRDL